MYTYPKILPMVPLCSEKFYLFLFWSRLVHADLAMHATGCARHLTPLYVPVSLCTRSATCKPCPMALVPDSTVHCSRPPARNLDLSWSDHALGPWVGFIYIFLFLAPYARTTRYEEVFLPEGKKRPRSLRSLGLASL